MSVDKKAEVLAVKRNWIVKAPKSLANEVERANEMLAGRGLNVGKRGAAVLQLAIDASVAEEEGYVLTVNEKGVSITGRTATGVFYGLMTLDQLLRADASSVCCDYLPALTIKDAPRTNVRASCRKWRATNTTRSTSTSLTTRHGALKSRLIRN